MKNHYYFFVVLFFVLGLINVVFSLLGLLCFVLPFILLKIKKKNVWCQIYCPRKSYLSLVLSPISLRIKKPKWFNYKTMKSFMVKYLTLNLFFAVMSSMMIFLGRAPEFLPFSHVRFLIVFELFELPQLIHLNVGDALIHFSYRIYSIMFSSTILGLMIGFLLGPNTWCAVCPMNYYLNEVNK
jgi:hypothetical protein